MYEKKKLATICRFLPSSVSAQMWMWLEKGCEMSSSSDKLTDLDGLSVCLTVSSVWWLHVYPLTDDMHSVHLIKFALRCCTPMLLGACVLAVLRLWPNRLNS